MRIVGRAERSLKPRVLVGGVVGNQVHQHFEPHLVGARDQLVEVGERPVLRVDVAVVGDVIALVLLRRGIEGREPYSVGAQPFDVVQAGRDAG